MSWTPEKVSKLKELWGKGNTAAQIASIIGEVTRNAVIGKAHRLNLAEKSIPKSTYIPGKKNFSCQEKIYFPLTIKIKNLDLPSVMKPLFQSIPKRYMTREPMFI